MTSSGFVLKHKNRKVFATGWTEEVWRSPVQVLRLEPFGKIRIFNIIFSIKIRYCYSCQVDPECSGWFNTSSFFFFFSLFFHISHFFLHISMFSVTCHSAIHNHTNSHSYDFCNAPSWLNIPSFLQHPDINLNTLTHTHADDHAHTQPVSRQLYFSSFVSPVMSKGRPSLAFERKASIMHCEH